jgi:polysaccharide export outer membrane protein
MVPANAYSSYSGSAPPITLNLLCVKQGEGTLRSFKVGIRMIRIASSVGNWTVVRAMACVVLLALSFAPRAHAQQLPDYTMNPGDVLDISVWKEDQLTKSVIVRPDGKFSFPLAGEIVAIGRTVAQVQAEITNRLKPYMPEPVVSASIKELDGCKIYVIGQVNKPGSYVMNPRISVLQGLSLAGGMTPFAGVNDIIVLRGPGAAQRIFPFRYGEVSKGHNLNQNVLLEAGDVIVVP